MGLSRLGFIQTALSHTVLAALLAGIAINIMVCGMYVFGLYSGTCHIIYVET